MFLYRIWENEQNVEHRSSADEYNHLRLEDIARLILEISSSSVVIFLLESSPVDAPGSRAFHRRSCRFCRHYKMVIDRRYDHQVHVQAIREMYGGASYLSTRLALAICQLVTPFVRIHQWLLISILVTIPSDNRGLFFRAKQPVC